MISIEFPVDKLAPAVHMSELFRNIRRGCLLVCVVALAFAATACTTTEHVVDTQPIMRNSSPSSTSEVRIAESVLESGDIALASTLFGKVVKSNPRSVAGLTGLGDTLYAVGDFTRAVVYYQKAHAIDHSAVAPMIGIARTAIRQRRFDDAITAYRGVLSQVPHDPMASAGLGAALDMKGDHRGAQAWLRRALNANPGDPSLSINLGLSLVLSGNPREGANVLLDVTRFPGAPPQARQDLALAYGLLGNTQAAAEILGKDLPKASVQDNLRFYEIQRARMALQGETAPAQNPSVPRRP
jgi:Flp pilus assembly protein TadD